MRIDHPYRNLRGGQWLRGNLHAHTNRSDGLREPQAVIDDYADRGYDFLSISDHDILTTAADYRQWDTHGMVMIPGNEITANGPHLLHVDARKHIAPNPLRQKVINDVIASGGGGFVVVNHPNWQSRFDHCPLSCLEQWVDYAGMEIYNGVISRLEGSPYATNKWDMLLAAGRRIWGFANDDSHWGTNDIALGWNMVYAEKRSRSAIIDAMRKGRFYASTGVTINHITVRRNRITIKTDNARRIVALRQTGKRIAQVDEPVIELDVPDDATYVRFECWGDGEQFAWTQPFFITK